MAEKTEILFVKLNGKNYISWEFQFWMFVRGNIFWRQIDGSNDKNIDIENWSWAPDDAKINSWILNSVEPLYALNQQSYSTAKEMWNYLQRVYNQENSAQRFQLGYDLSEYSQGNKTIEEYYAGFINLWMEYNSLAYATVSEIEIPALQKLH